MISRLKRWMAGSDEPATEAETTRTPVRPEPVEVTDATFDEAVLAADGLVLVDFWADWCQPCTIMAAYVGFLLEAYGDRLVVAALDVEENPATADRFGVQGLPTLIFFRDGEEIGRQLGVVDYETLRERVARMLETEQVGS